MLFVGDDWAEDHHDVEIVDDDGRVLQRQGDVGFRGPVSQRELSCHCRWPSFTREWMRECAHRCGAVGRDGGC
jgi:hypothetical protein